MAGQVYFATEQLDDAGLLFEVGRFASARTLAGAADEIFSEMASDRVKLSFLEYKYEDLGPVLTELLPLSKEDFINENRALITVTRMAPTSTPSITPDKLEYEAHSMIVRALYNYDQLGLPRTARMLEFENRLMLELENQFYDDWVGPITYNNEAI